MEKVLGHDRVGVDDDDGFKGVVSEFPKNPVKRKSLADFRHIPPLEADDISVPGDLRRVIRTVIRYDNDLETIFPIVEPVEAVDCSRDDLRLVVGRHDNHKACRRGGGIILPLPDRKEARQSEEPEVDIDKQIDKPEGKQRVPDQSHRILFTLPGSPVCLPPDLISRKFVRKDIENKLQITDQKPLPEAFRLDA